MMQTNSNYVFGPVPSRRLGRSLGVDLIPFKTCSYDCIYCQLGRTTNKTVFRKEWIPLDTIWSQLQERMDNTSQPPDHITLSGSGEPTLYSRIGELIERIHAAYKVPVAVLTNSSLLWDKDVRAQIKQADLIVPSLDAGSKTMFYYINRPHDSISFSQMLDGLIQLRQEFSHNLWLEVFLLAGHTAVRFQIEQMVECTNTIQPDRIQLNTVARPPAEEFAYAVPEERMVEFAQAFDPPAEVIAEYKRTEPSQSFDDVAREILSILSRRPCTVQDLTLHLGIPHNLAIKQLDHLLSDDKVAVRNVKNQRYYTYKRSG